MSDVNNLYYFIKSLCPESKYILNMIQKKGPIDKNTLSNITKHKMTKLNRLMQPLEECGIILGNGEGNSTGGRKPILYDVNTRDYYIVNLANVTTQYTISIVNLKAKCVAHRIFPMTKELTPDEYFTKAMSVISELMEEISISPDMLIGVGISAFGSVDRKEGKISKQSVIYISEKWIGAPLVKMFSEALNVPAVLDIMSNAEMLCHYLYGGNYDVKRFMYLHSAMSIRSAFLSSNKIIRTTNDCDDAFGHMTVNFGGESCKCGSYGCIDAYSAIPAIINQFTLNLKLGRVSTVQKPIEEIEFVDIAKAADEGDALAGEVISYAASVLGQGLVNYINLLNPDIVLLSGIIVRNCDLFCDVVTKTALKRLNKMFDNVDLKIIRNDYTMNASTICGGVIFIEAMVDGIV